MSFGQKRSHELGSGGEDGAVLLVCVRRGDEQADAELVARDVRCAEALGQQPRAVRLANAGQAHEHDQRRRAVRPRGDSGDL